jgi:hypothetical protein
MNFKRGVTWIQAVRIGFPKTTGGGRSQHTGLASWAVRLVGTKTLHPPARRRGMKPARKVRNPVILVAQVLHLCAPCVEQGDGRTIREHSYLHLNAPVPRQLRNRSCIRLRTIEQMRARFLRESAIGAEGFGSPHQRQDRPFISFLKRRQKTLRGAAELAWRLRGVRRHRRRPAGNEAKCEGETPLHARPHRIPKPRAIKTAARGIMKIRTHSILM